MSKPKSWILHGPQGTRKPEVARQLARQLGLGRVIEEWDSNADNFEPVGVLYIYDEPLPAWAAGNRRVVHINQARQWVAKAAAA